MRVGDVQVACSMAAENSATKTRRRSDARSGNKRITLVVRCGDCQKEIRIPRQCIVRMGRIADIVARR
jgi:uncharacterized membrane protein